MKLKRWHWISGSVVFIIIAALIAARLYLGVWMLNYVNQVLANIPGYQGSVASIDIHLYRGAYSVHGLKINKKTGRIPTPFVAIETADISIQWSALLNGRIVSDVELYKPVLNFAVNASGTTEQTGAGVDWTKPIKELSPIDINQVKLHDGKITYQDFSTTPKVNIYMHHMNGEVNNLRNVVEKDKPLPSEFKLAGDSIGGGKLAVRGHLNILKPVPDADLNFKLENVNLPALSDYSDAYAAIDIKGGTLSVYSELKIKDNHVSGYVKPIATNVSIIDLRKPTNPIKLVWEVVVATVVEIFTNQTHDQFATKIQLEGNLGDINTDTWSTLTGIFRNAFIEAFKKGLDRE